MGFLETLRGSMARRSRSYQNTEESLKSVAEAQASHNIDAPTHVVGASNAQDEQQIQSFNNSNITFSGELAGYDYSRILRDKQKNIIKSLFNFGDQSQFKNNYKNDEQFARCFPFMDYQFNLLQASIIELSKNNAFSGKQQSVGERSMLTITQEYVHVLYATCQPTLCCVR